MVEYADQLSAYLRGEDSLEALAAGIEVCTVLELLRQRLEKGG